MKRSRSAIYVIPDDVIPPPPADADAARALPKGFSKWFICRMLRLVGWASLADDGNALGPGQGKFQGAILHIAFAYILWALPMTSMGVPGGFSWGITLGFYAGQFNGMAKAWALWLSFDARHDSAERFFSIALYVWPGCLFPRIALPFFDRSRRSTTCSAD